MELLNPRSPFVKERSCTTEVSTVDEGTSPSHGHSHTPRPIVKPTDKVLWEIGTERNTCRENRDVSQARDDGERWQSQAIVGQERPNYKRGKPAIATVAWMVLTGDSLHNFMDGLSIGAGFRESVMLGVSISIACLCEELPHELGDKMLKVGAGLAILAIGSLNGQTWLSRNTNDYPMEGSCFSYAPPICSSAPPTICPCWGSIPALPESQLPENYTFMQEISPFCCTLVLKRALFYNFLAAVVCYFGLILGIFLGENMGANRWIFAMAGGMFLYVSLVDMLPEVIRVAETEDKRSAGHFKLFVLQNTGLLPGLIIIYVMAHFVGAIVF